MSDEALVGFFVAGEGQQTTATFDNIRVGLPGGHRTSWIGSSAGKVSTDFVSFGMHDFYVAPDGTAYKYSQAAEQGHALNVINPDGTLKKLPYGNYDNFGFYQGGIAGDGGYIYLASRDSPTSCQPGTKVLRKTMDLAPAGGPLPFGAPTLGLIGGLGARAGKVYVSDVAVNEGIDGFCPYPLPPPSRPSLVRILDFNANPPTESQFPFERPGPLAVDDSDRIWIIQDATDYPVLDLGPCLNPRGETAACPGPEPNGCPIPSANRFFCPCTVERARHPGNFVVKHPGRIECRHADGTPCMNAGQSAALAITADQLGYASATDFNPMGVTFDRGNPADPSDDRLLVADNGPRQNIIICTGLSGGSPTGQPSCVDFGAAGGVFSGASPGVVDDPAAGGQRRFFSPLKAGVDASGNIYVASSAPQVDIRKFTPGGQLAWAVYGLSPEHGAFDPGTDGRDFVSTSRHYTFDPTKTEAGTEWGLKAFTWRPFGGPPPGDWYGDTLNPGSTTSLFPRRLAADSSVASMDRKRFLYQLRGSPLEVHFHRFPGDGEVAVPFGSLIQVPVRDGDCNDLSVPDVPGCLRLWVDRDGDGVEDRGTNPDPCRACEGFQGVCEVETIPSASLPPGGFVPNVDDKGNVWLGWADRIWELPAAWPGGATTPDYHLTPLSTMLPAEVAPTLGAVVPDFHVESGASDSLYVFASKDGGQNPAPACAGPNPPCWCNYRVVNTVTRYDNWHSGMPTLAPGYPVLLPAPQLTATQPDDFANRFADPLCFYCAEGADYRGFDVAGGMFFVQKRNGAVLAYNATTGAAVTELFAGPEVTGYQFWTDVALPGSMRAFQRSTGEYLLTMLDSSNQARTIVYRWTPPGQAGWTPAQLSPRAWYVASPSDVTLANGAVAQWTNRAGSDLHLTNSFEPGRPIYDPNGWAPNRPAVRFNGAALLRNDQWSGSPAGDNKEFTVLAVIKPAASQNAAPVAWWHNQGGQHIRCKLKNDAGQTVLDVSRADAAWMTQSASGTSDLGTGPHVVAWRFSPNVFKLTVDGTTQHAGVGSIGEVALNTLVMGAMTTLPTGLYNGTIAELVIVPASIADVDVAAFRSYAQATWGGGLP